MKAMYRFNQNKIKASKPEARNTNVAGNCSGFTLIELLSAISITAVLVGLLLPVIQKKREEYAANKATQHLTAMIAASNEYFRRMGSFPDSIPKVVQFCQANPASCSLDPQLAGGELGGYLYTLTDFGPTLGLTIEAEPEYPGITGSYTLTIGPNGIVNRTPTPGSDEARQRAFDNILTSGARTVVSLLALDRGATSQVRDYAESPDRVPEVFDLIDGDGNGSVSIIDIDWGDGAVGFTDTIFDDAALKRPLESLLASVARELRLDSLSEADRVSISVVESEITGFGEDLLLSYDGLRDLTSILVRDGSSTTVLNSLLSRLNAAETAEANGNEKKKSQKLKEYRMLVNGQVGRTLTRANANTLVALADCLVSS